MEGGGENLENGMEWFGFRGDERGGERSGFVLVMGWIGLDWIPWRVLWVMGYGCE
jgi:hypothetical protein